MAQTAHSLVPVNLKSLMSIDPQKNWRRFPPPVANMARANAVNEAHPIHAGSTDWFGGTPNSGANAGNSGETGTITSTVPLTGYAWTTQVGKAAALGLPMAVDVTKSYEAGARGVIEPHERYPSVNTAEVPAKFRDSNTLLPGGP